MTTAQEAHEYATAGDQVIGWKLDRGQRAELLARFPPRYAQAVADHVTLKPDVGADSPFPDESGALIVGRADDGRGVEAMVVRVAGTSDRPDGGTYHITWSLAPGRDAHESNQVIATRGWDRIDPPVPVRLLPGIFPRS